MWPPVGSAHSSMSETSKEAGRPHSKEGSRGQQVSALGRDFTFTGHAIDVT